MALSNTNTAARCNVLLRLFSACNRQVSQVDATRCVSSACVEAAFEEEVSEGKEVTWISRLL